MRGQSGTPHGPQAPDSVGEHRHELFEEARWIAGERFAESRIDPDRGLRVTVIDLDDEDVTAITGVARQLNVEGWVRIERADPVALESWEQLHVELLRLDDVSPRVLRGHPMPNPGYQRPPVEIDLAPDAEATAADLYARFGDFIALQVSALAYPPDPAAPPANVGPADSGLTPVDPAEIRIEMGGPLSVRSGVTTTHHVLVTNLTDHTLVVETNGHLTATVRDPDTGAPVGG